MSTLTWAVAAVVADDAGRVLLCRQGRGERRWALPGGRLRRDESPLRAVTRDIRAETGWTIEIVDLLGLYRLTGPAWPPAPAGRCGPLPDVLVHVFRARVSGAGPMAEPVAGCHPAWHDPHALPEAVTPTTRAAVADALAGRSGVLRDNVTETAPSAGAAPHAEQGHPGDKGRPVPHLGRADSGGGRRSGAEPAGELVPPGQRTEPDGIRTTGP